MSMLSSMTAGLRNRANELRFFAGGMNAPFILPETKESTRISMRNAVVDLEYAADTIDYLRNTCNDLQRDNEKLKQLVRDMWHDGMCDCDERGACTECEYGYLERMREAGIEV